MAYTNQVPNFTAEGIEPPETTLTDGFRPGEKPPANCFNFLLNTITQALIELQEKAYESENLSTDLADYLTKAIIKQTTGNSTTDVMSQKAVTDYVTTQMDSLPDLLKGTAEPTDELGKDGDYYVKYS